MAKAPPEGLRPGLPLLEYADLTFRRNFWGGPILSPDKIPIHPKVYEADFAYNKEFALEALMAIPASLARDIVAIEEKTGKRLGLELIENGIIERGKFVSYGDFFTTVDPRIQEVGVDRRFYADVNAWMCGTKPVIKMPFEHPMPKDKLSDYYVDPDKYGTEGTLVWNAHNVGNLDTATLLVFRNFAIMFNNLGLQKVGTV